jgi:uncharacterized phosphosugar-binding protein
MMSRVPETHPLPWLDAAQALLARVGATQGAAIEQASRWCADAIAADGLVHLFGTGHSRFPVSGLSAVLVIDLCTPPADALITLEGLETPVGPGSTVTAVAIVNSLKVRIAELLVERGAMPPVLTRRTVVGPERSQAPFDAAYREHAWRLARAIIQQHGAGHQQEV